MPRTIISSFAGGECSPSLYGRVDLQRYPISCKTLKNFIVHPHGSISNAPGTEYIAETKDSTKHSRLIPFEVSDEQSYVIELGNQYMRFYSQGGQLVVDSADAWVTSTAYILGDYVTSSAVIYYCLVSHTSGTFATDLAAGKWVAQTILEVPTDYLEADIDRIKYTQSADVMYLTHNNYPIMQLTRTAVDEFVMEEFEFNNGPFMKENTSATTITPSAVSGNITLTSSTSIFDSDHVGSLFKVTHDVQAKTLSSRATTTGLTTMTHTFYGPETYSNAIYCLGNYTISGTAMKWSWDGTNTYMKLQSSIDAITWTDVNTYHANFTYSGTTSQAIYFRTGCPELTYYWDDDPVYYEAYTSFTCSQAIEVNANEISTVNWRFITHGTWSAKLHIQRSTDNGSTWQIIESYSGANDYNITSSGSETEFCLLRVYLYEYTSGTVYYDFYVDEYTHNGIVSISAYTSGTSVSASVVNRLSSATATDLWAFGAWSEYNGYPGCCDFYQNRLVFASTTSEPQTFWASKTDDYPNFGISTDVQDDDRVQDTLVSRKLNKIRNIFGLGEIIALTSAANWLIGAGSSGDVFTPTNKRAKCQGFRGCSEVQPAVIENRVIYIQSQGSTVRDLGYTLDSDSWAGNDISIFASHLLKGYTISDMTYQQEPDSIVWFVRSDGKLLGLTYVAEQEVLAWHRHETTGSYESITSIPGAGYDELWVIVNRANGRFVERFVERMASDDVEDQVFLHSSLTYNSTATKTITGLSHLDGQTVNALADGFVVKGLTVSSGSISLDTAASLVHVGLPYESEIEPLTVEISLSSGISQGIEKQINELTVRLQNSLGGQVGRTSDDLYEINYRTNEPWGTQVALFSGDKKIDISSDWNSEDTFIIRQTDPLPLTVLAVIFDVRFGG